MKNIHLHTLRQIGKAIHAIDANVINTRTVHSKTNIRRTRLARKHLINILFSCGYELEWKSYKVIKSTQTRELI